MSELRLIGNFAFPLLVFSLGLNLLIDLLLLLRVQQGDRAHRKVVFSLFFERIRLVHLQIGSTTNDGLLKLHLNF